MIEPAVLLLDEPFGALDKKLRENMQIEMRQLQQRLGITTLMVTHDQDEALTLSDRIAVMRADGSSSSARRPRSTSGRCRVSSRASSARRISSPATSPAGTMAASRSRARTACRLGLNGVPPNEPNVTVALRPEGIQLSPANGDVAGERHAHHDRADRLSRPSTHYLLRRPEGEPLIVVRQNDAGADAFAGLEPGASVLASWAAERNLVVRDDA